LAAAAQLVGADSIITLITAAQTDKEKARMAEALKKKSVSGK